ncbi:BON domain-containing protein [uncultured Thiohalocapsa sp.]|uniref:BON domain-containing protein n=1 Tax=uncultured Thiohalocapsa sp. TaxID=768990 RepID=UPI0025D95B8F|nr:BON domain-containing protein [uncultured Thiohalocapsa sp.]
MSHPRTLAHRLRRCTTHALAAALVLQCAAAVAASGAATRAQTLIDLNPILSGYAIQVRPSDTGLRLEGSVADAAEQQLAQALAVLVADGAEIDNALGLDAELPDTPGPLFGADEDATIATRLRQTLDWQKDTAGLGIELEVNRGEVRLNGQVGTTGTKDRVAALAATTEGVDAVFNYISVDPANIPAIREQQAQLADAERADAWIASRLRRLLQFDTTVNAHSIEVEARDGTAILSGAVTSSAERNVAEGLAANLPGVREVDSRLVIERPR